MIGKKYNNQTGQALLIIVMLLATVMTIIIAVSHRAVTQTQLTKVQEESVRTLAAADSAIELGLKSTSTGNIQTFREAGLTTLQGIDLDESKIIISTNLSNQFVSPLIPKDQQYTFYLADYPGFSQNNFSGNIKLFMGSEGGGLCSTRDTPALEVTLIYDTNETKKWLVEPCSSSSYISGNSKITPTTQSQTILGTTFAYRTADNDIQVGQSTLYQNAKILIVRPLYAATKVGFTTTASSFSPQGKTIQSEARTYSGVTKVVQVFQSYPQFPADFFVTSF